MLGAMTSLTGGGGLDFASTASADGDASFTNGNFDYRTGKADGNNQLLIMSAIALAFVAFVASRQ